MDFVYDVPASRVVFGTGRIRQVPDEVQRLGAERVVLIAGGQQKKYADGLAAALGPRLVDRIGEVVMHVPASLATAASERTEQSRADLMVCLGGGSAIGLAKAVALRTGLPILAVPTTYAGSEMTPIWGLTDGGRKTTGRDRTVLPATVVYDPALTTSLPTDISAASGMNALAHLVEGLYAPNASPVTAVLAEEGIRALADALPRVVVAPRDLDARTYALYGAWLAGCVLGTAGMGLHHKICHVLGGAYNLPHAGTHSAVLPFVTAYNAPAAPAAMVRAARALGAQDPARALWELARRIGAPTSLAQVGLDPAEFRRPPG
ncbi:MAG TPA: maleylacetate reductase [Pseudonocardiaceae bacterium]|nr:maleylacetate reductase [Pseudonocardiaceae bacterium]